MLKKLLLALLILTTPIWAAYTTVSDTLYQANGNLYSGIIDIAWQTFTGADGRAMPAGHFQLHITSGVLSVGLEPNDTATPSGTSYRVTYALNSGLPSPEYWVVPTSITPVNLATIRTAPPPSPSLSISASQITGVLVRAQGGTNNTAGRIPQLFSGSGPPGTVTGNLPGDSYDDLTNHLTYWCAAPTITATPACTSVTTSGWTLAGSATGTVTSITLAGTAGQITVTGTCTITTSGTCTFSLPSGLVLPGTINKLTLTTPATGATLTIADGKTITISNTLTFNGTDSTVITFPAPAGVTNGDCVSWTKSGSNIGFGDAGSACSSGSLTGSGTTGYFSKWTGSNALGNSVCDESQTTPSTITCTLGLATPTWTGTGSDPYIKFPSNPGHTPATGDFWNNAGALKFSSDTVCLQTAANCSNSANCTVAGSNGDLQMKSGSACAASHVNDDGTTVTSTEPVVASSYTSSDASHSGLNRMKGHTSGEVALGVPDVAGTAIVYMLPSTNGSTGQVLEDNGSATCATYTAGAPATCHQLIWASAGSSTWATPTYPYGSLGGGTVTFSSSNNLVSFYPISAGTISSVTFWKTSADTGSHMAVGVYDSTCTLITNGNSLTVTAGGANTFPVFTFAVNPVLNGYGWLAFTSDNAGGTTTAFSGNIDGGNGNSSTLANVAQTTVFTGNSSTGTTTITMPVACGSKVAISLGGNPTYPALFLWH